jgi:glucose/arabinose dehydrogenase
MRFLNGRATSVATWLATALSTLVARAATPINAYAALLAQRPFLTSAAPTGPEYSLTAVAWQNPSSLGFSDAWFTSAGGSSVPKPASLLLVGVAWLCCAGLGIRRSRRPATTRHRFSCLAACVAIGTLLGMSLTVHAAEQDLLNDPLYFSGTTLNIRPYAAMPSGFNDIIGMTFRPDDTRMYVTTSEGTIFAINDNGAGATSAQPWFNASNAVLAATGRSMNGNGGQQGLQSVAFHPDFDNVGSPGYGKLYTTMLEDRPANPGSAVFKYLGNSSYGNGGADGVLAEWTYDFNAGQVTTNSYRELFRVNMPNYDHPIKQARFNPYAEPGDEDYGLLYMTHGDSNNQDSPNDDPQDLGDVMGKMIRINPLQSGADRYTIPATNPFASSANPDVLKEVYAYGFRNPHVFSFNPDDQGDIHILVGDIGRDNIEEVNLVKPGQNYGWAEREGTFVHHQYTAPHPDTGYIDGVDQLPANEATDVFDNYGTRYTYPVAQWDHNGEGIEVGADWWTGNSIASSFVIQNGSDPALDNQFIHLNFSSNHGDVYHNDFDAILNAVTQLDPSDPNRDEPSDLTQAENFRLHLSFDDDNDPSTAPQLWDDFNDLIGNGGWARSDARFGEGLLGEMYISSKWDGRVYIVTNSVPYNADFDGNLIVDDDDYLIWQSNQNMVGYGTAGDANHDGFVNDQDLAIWQDQFVLSGDYNGDGRVDAADYTVWRNHLGTSDTLPNDLSPGMVTVDDYNVWKQNFGAVLPAGAGGAAAVPEPASWLLLAGATCVLLAVRRI